ncbi:hypothetical protein B0T17DRAFT_143746 [Bombardia bombarda]|uniref:RRM domain-containing protein n=1 Tax=Bombardia bombarda TaxID=252184 RepID=A0AA39X757_9PEZI|nr:hypothetical protein B0T17DRAFT_143746 [Bombardia bombarda]
MHLESINGAQNPTSASSIAPSSKFVSLSLNRTSSFPAFTSATKNAMAAPAFLPHAQSFRPSVTSQTAFAHPITSGNSFDRDATKPGGAPFSAAPSPLSSARIRKLPLNTSEESLRLMMVFSKELVDVDVLPADQSEDDGFRSAIIRFKTLAGAQEAKKMLNGKSNISNDADLIVEVMGSSPSSLGKRYPIDTNVSSSASSAASSAASPVSSSRQAPRFNGFQPLDKITPLNGESNSHYQNIFSPQSPIGNHLTDRARVTGKSLITKDTADDDDTGELLKDPVGFAENGLQRRQTAPQIPISRMATLSLNTTPTTGPSPISHYGHPGMPSSLSTLSNTMSPTTMATMSPTLGFNPPQQQQQQQQPYRGHHSNFPPANPADQNPPCNTLYVGNLPIDTSEEELKAMFSKQRGYRRLCFRTKQNGPMCFVEFEDVSFATKALNELYGQLLHNSTKGGIRLSFSKNPLGVRSGQTPGQSSSSSASGMNGIHSVSGNGFTTASGPPPGLSAPPGLGMNRSGFSAAPSLATGGNNQYISSQFSGAPNNLWGGGMYTGYSHAPMMASASSGYPPHMMGR